MKKIIVTGNVGKDAESKTTREGNSFVTFSLGVSTGTRQAPQTDWVDVTCNDRLAQFASEYIKKGSKLLVEGFPSVSAYLNKDNKPVATLRIKANNIEILSRREDTTRASEGSYNPGTAATTNADGVYNLPDDDNEAMNIKSDDVPF